MTIEYSYDKNSKYSFSQVIIIALSDYGITLIDYDKGNFIFCFMNLNNPIKNRLIVCVIILISVLLQMCGIFQNEYYIVLLSESANTILNHDKSIFPIDITIR